MSKSYNPAPIGTEPHKIGYLYKPVIRNGELVAQEILCGDKLRKAVYQGDEFVSSENGYTFGPGAYGKYQIWGDDWAKKLDRKAGKSTAPMSLYGIPVGKSVTPERIAQYKAYQMENGTYNKACWDSIYPSGKSTSSATYRSSSSRSPLKYQLLMLLLKKIGMPIK